MNLAPARAGAREAAPILFGVVPFGLVAGAAPVAGGLGADVAVGMSTVVFAGASQLAAIDVLVRNGSPLVAAMAAWMINFRLLLYSASLAPPLARERLRTRLVIAYLLVDQAYALSITRWDGTDEPLDRVPYILGVGVTLWIGWQLATLAGAAVGAAVPASIPLDFAVAVVFLVLLVPMLVGVPAVSAAIVAGVVTIVAAELGAGHLALVTGALCGIAAGTVADAVRATPAVSRE